MNDDNHGPRHTRGAHSHGPANYNKAFAIGVGLNIAYVLLEASFGL